MPKEITNTAQRLQPCTLPQMILVWIVLCVFVVSSTGLLPTILSDLSMDQFELVENEENESESDHNESKLEKDKDNFIQMRPAMVNTDLTKLLGKNIETYRWENRHQDISTPPPEHI